MMLLRKISPATVTGGKENFLELVIGDKEKSHPVMRVVGICTGAKVGEGKEGFKDWKALTGNFEATDVRTGEVYRSGVCFMPEFAVEIVAGQLNDEVTSVRFAFDIGVHYDKDSATSYVYDVTPLMEADPETDPLAKLAAAVNSTKQIAAPKR